MKLLLNKKNIIKIPKNISVFFCENNILVIKGLFFTKSIKLKTQIKIFSKNKIILVTSNLLNNSCKKINFFFNAYVTYIKQVIKETLKQSKKKLNIIGVGYKVILLTYSSFTILQLKLGYSHFIYIRIPKNLIVICPKPNKIFFYGYFKQKINILAFLIKSYKMPEPYKAKGIFYSNEQIKLKKGKKL
jgi:large subunit ribosomal protein L6